MDPTQKEFELWRFVEDGENELGQPIQDWQPIDTITGYLDLMTGDEAVSSLSYIQESSHLLMCWDMDVAITKDDKIKNPRDGYEYEVTFVDDPMELGSHYEIYCKKVA